MNLFTLTLVILSGALIVVFIQDIGKFFKRLAKIPGVLLFAPLLVVSAALLHWQDYVYLSVVHVQEVFFWPIRWLDARFGSDARIPSLTLLITLTTLLPVWLFDIWLRRSRHYGLAHPGWVHGFLFILAIMLFWVLPFVS